MPQMKAKIQSNFDRLAMPRRVHRWLAGQRGISLVTVAALGSVAMLWLFAISAAIVPLYQKISETRYFTVVRSSAEAGLDYVVNELNKGIDSGTLSPLDDPTTDGAPKITELPSSAIGNSMSTVTVSVNNVLAPSDSSIWLQQYQSTGWRVVEATATYAGFSKTIRVILQPQTNAPLTPPSVPKPYFEYAMFGRALVSMSGNAATDSYSSSALLSTGNGEQRDRDGNVGSNTYTKLSGNAFVGGHLVVRATPSDPNTVVAERGSNVIINDEVQLNTNAIGDPDDNFNGDSSDPSSMNVKGETTLVNNGYLYPDGYDAYKLNLSEPPVTFPPAPAWTAGENAYEVGTISISGNGSIIIDPDAPAPSGSIVANGNRTIRIPPGDYKVSNFTTAGNGRIEILSTVTTPVRIFVEGNVSGTNAVQITGNGIVNGTQKPSMFQFWYNGSKTIKLAGNGNLHGVVYAPNATLNISGNGTYYGGMVANIVDNSGNGRVHFDRDLTNTTGASALVYDDSAAVAAQVDYLKTVSWQEL